MRIRTAVPLAIAATAMAVVHAHKPITSKFTYNEHVFPIVRDRCSRCHVDGGVAPMSLTTYQAAFPWAESIKSELLAGHMPPTAPLSARELDVLMTWATGGTPEGPAAAEPNAVALRNDWPLGPPDLVVRVPAETVLAPGQMEETREFVLPSEGIAGRAIRAVDLRPGMPAVVRRATFYLRRERLRPARGERVPERHSASERGWGPASIGKSLTVLAFWLPGGETTPTSAGTAFMVPDDAEIVARVTFRKTWKYENDAVRDRSEVGFYFAPAAARAVQTIAVPREGGVRLPSAAEIVAVDVADVDGELVVRTTRPDGSRAVLLSTTGHREWPRRVWLSAPVRLPRGARLTTAAPTIVSIVLPGQARDRRRTR